MFCEPKLNCARIYYVAGHSLILAHLYAQLHSASRILSKYVHNLSFEESI
jgi:hypothetical protein